MRCVAWLWSVYGSRGQVEPVVGLVVQLWALGTQVRVRAAGLRGGRGM